jgi:hypothetical protein
MSMKDECGCPYCTLQRDTEARHRLEHDPGRAAMVALYIRRFRMSHVEALAALDFEDDRFWKAAVAHAEMARTNETPKFYL